MEWSRPKEVADKGRIVLETCRALNTVDSDALKAEEGYCWISVNNLERVREVRTLSLSEVTRIVEGLVLKTSTSNRKTLYFINVHKDTFCGVSISVGTGQK